MPKLNYLKFLELIGIELTPAQPAQRRDHLPRRADVRRADRHRAAAHAGRGRDPGRDAPIVFETERALIALTAQLDAVQLDSGFDVADVSAANADAQTGFAPFGQTARRARR